MAARTIPTLPTWTAGMRVTGANLAAMVSYQQFWANPPSFRMYQTIAQSIANNSWTQITCDTSEHDSDSGRGGSTPWSYTIPTGLSGRWTFGWIVPWAVNSTGNRAANLYKNAAAVTTYPVSPGVASNGTSLGWTDEISCVSGDVMALYAWQGSGGSLNTATGTGSQAIFWGRLVSLGSP